METKDPTLPVRNEQNGSEKNASGDTENKEKEFVAGNEDMPVSPVEEDTGKEEAEPVPLAEESLTEDPPDKKKKKKGGRVKEPEEAVEEEGMSGEKKESVPLEEGVAVPDKSAEKELPGQEEVPSAGEGSQPEEEITVEPVDYATHTKHELIEILRILIDTKPVDEIRDDVESIKLNFYKKHRAEIEQLRKRFLEDGNNPEDFKPMPDLLEEELKDLHKRYRLLRSEYNKLLDSRKDENLREKYGVIAEIEKLINSEESINKTFQDFRDLQSRWRETGLVPQQHVKDLWENYHYQVERFYDYIKINKELRDLDLRKNLETKISLCKRAEELMLENNVVTAFRELQDLHDQWRESGPVPRENREEIWERFREATTQINKRHQDHFVSLKDKQKKNLEAKTGLCEKLEAILEEDIQTPRQWEDRSKEVIELQKLWKTIGFAPKKQNNKVYRRFREASDNFFKQKRAFYSGHKEEQKNNLQAKTDLCVQAEALCESTDWKKTTELLIGLQKKWKEIGPVPRKHADQVWKRFRAACDRFFENKSKHFASREEDFAKNLETKLKLIEEIEAYVPGDDQKASFEQIQEFQKQWTEIGFVPSDKKEEVQSRYRNAINNSFDKLKMDDSGKNLLKYKSRLEGMKSGTRSDFKLQQERDKFIARIKQLENDIVLWENNIGFFAKSKNADAMIRDVQSRIDQAKKEIKVLEEKVRLIDNFEPED